VLYGVFSDVHSNLEALTAVLEHFRQQNVQGYICCGDLVGYGPDPDPCLDLIRQLPNLSVIVGNHDLAVIGKLDVEWFNAYARAAALWTRDKISDGSRQWLDGLKARLDCKEFTLAHGSPRKPAEEYLLSPAQFKDQLTLVSTWPLFVGHSHMPLLFQSKPDPTGEAAAEMRLLEPGEKVMIPKRPWGTLPTVLNPGSVGQPRDQDKRAACGLYDSTRGTFVISRVEYDIAAVQAKIRAAGLPEFLALRLAYGQ
jgi:diadenosine tetraphosphatase ApaH/serine/threonine PP2A family protein phosphatase